MAILDSQSKKMCNIQIEFYKNRDRTIRMTIQNNDLGDITGSSLWLAVKLYIDKLDSDALILKKSADIGGGDDEAKVVDGENRIVEFYIKPEDTVDLDPGEYFADAVIKLPGVGGRKLQLVDPFLISLKQPVTIA